jgi:hypothetical protein
MFKDPHMRVLTFDKLPSHSKNHNNYKITL